MCGIHLCYSFSRPPPPVPIDIEDSLRSRGPDHFGSATVSLDASRVLHFTSTVLSLRGNHVTVQPFVDAATGSVLCWNGEAWCVDGRRVDGNDGRTVFRLLMDADSGVNAVVEALRLIEGPFAFVFWNGRMKRLFYGRDRLGRRSLLECRQGSSLVLSSVAGSASEGWKEVVADGIHVQEAGTNTLPSPARHDWCCDPESDYVSGIGKFCAALPSEKLVLSAQSPAVAQLRDWLVKSLKLRVLNIPKPRLGSEDDTRVAVLFSGGLDCTVLARLTHELLDANQSIDLINVAFENPRVAAQLRKDAERADLDVFEACPDRITGRRSFVELQSVCGSRKLRFVAVNIPYVETTAHRARLISLIHPHNTEMDLSIAYALYFAARGQGLVSLAPDSPPILYTTPARVLLSGLGADELFGGYSRHPAAFWRGGYHALIDELKLDVSRLGKRNLGRDDRAISRWGREARFPYLDERLVRWAMGRPVWEKCDFGNEGADVQAGKRVLRLVAADLGMPGVAGEMKRAIQFGARSAKMESTRKGTTVIT